MKSYKTNTAIARVRNIILDYARENHIAVYDWYEVAGGEGASTKWITDGLFPTTVCITVSRATSCRAICCIRHLKRSFQNNQSYLNKPTWTSQ